jgi:hypothetical protein
MDTTRELSDLERQQRVVLLQAELYRLEHPDRGEPTALRALPTPSQHQESSPLQQERAKLVDEEIRELQASDLLGNCGVHRGTPCKRTDQFVRTSLKVCRS